MRKLFVLLCATLLVASCISSLPGQFTRLADKVEKEGANYSDAEWRKATDQFTKMVDKYTDNYSSFDKEQKKEINRAIIRFEKEAIKHGVGNTAEIVEDALQELPSAVDDLMDSAIDILEGLGF